MHLDTGEYGENLALAYVLGLGYEVLGRNQSTEHIELDILAFSERRITIFEVKFRTASAFTKGDILSPAQEKRLKTATEILAEVYEAEVCLDLIEIIKFDGAISLRHFREIF